MPEGPRSGLKPHQKTMDWVRQRVSALACNDTYRPAAALLSTEIGDEISHGVVWGRVDYSYYGRIYA